MKRAVGGENNSPASGTSLARKKRETVCSPAQPYLGRCRRKGKHVASTANDARSIDKERWTRTVEQVAQSQAHLSFLAYWVGNQDTVQLRCAS